MLTTLLLRQLRLVLQLYQLPLNCKMDKRGGQEYHKKSWKRAEHMILLTFLKLEAGAVPSADHGIYTEP